MGVFSKWLLHDDQKALFEIVFAFTLNIVFLVLIALALWPLQGRPAMAFRLGKGYGILWVATYLFATLGNRIQEYFRVNLYDHPDAYVNSNLAASCFLQVGWSAFAALTVHGFVAGASTWIVASFYFAALLSCLIAFLAVSSFYQGHIYKLISLPLAIISFIVFSVWPVAARVTFGWFFDLFGARST
jgi:hypothetical protein